MDKQRMKLNIIQPAACRINDMNQYTFKEQTNNYTLDSPFSQNNKNNILLFEDKNYITPEPLNKKRRYNKGKEHICVENECE